MIRPAEDKQSQVQLPEAALEQFKAKFQSVDKAVDPSLFTAASIFCVSTSTQMADTYRLQVADKEESSADGSYINNMLIDYFKALKSEGLVNVAGQPTPYDPFVLGYSLRQRVPELSALHPGADQGKTPIYFLPRRVDTTTTAYAGDPYTAGTLNFCIQTHRQGPNAQLRKVPERKGPTPDLSAGHFKETLFKTLSQRAGPRVGIQPGGADAILGFSKEIFNDLWLRHSIIGRLAKDPSRSGRHLRAHSSADNAVLEEPLQPEFRDGCYEVKFKFKEFPIERDEVYVKIKRIAEGQYLALTLTFRLFLCQQGASRSFFPGLLFLSFSLSTNPRPQDNYMLRPSTTAITRTYPWRGSNSPISSAVLKSTLCSTTDSG